MPKLPCVSGVRVVKALGRLGFVSVASGGSHVVLRRGSSVCHQFIGKLTKEHCAACSAKLG